MSEAGTLTPELKAEIDGWSREEMARKWRFSKVGDPIFQGARGRYLRERFSRLGGMSPEISKRIGWEG